MVDTISSLLTLFDPAVAEERCGLVLRDGSLLELTNIHAEPKLGYKMDPAEVVKNLDGVIGTWHTHPDSSPNLSAEDYAGFTAWPRLIHHIVGLLNGEPTVKTYGINAGLVVGL